MQTRIENQAKHGISFEEATHVFDGPVLTKIDDRAAYDEVREITMGMLSPDAVLVVVHTERGENIRLISESGDRLHRVSLRHTCKPQTWNQTRAVELPDLNW